MSSSMDDHNWPSVLSPTHHGSWPERVSAGISTFAGALEAAAGTASNAGISASQQH